MRLFMVILAFATLLGGDDPKKKGREGNTLYAAGELAAAADAYRAGISGIQAEGPGVTHAGLLNNLGASLYRQGDFSGAVSSFSSSANMSLDDASRVRAQYNAGNALTKADELESALDMYRQALLQDPSNQDAKFNYEFVKRKLQDQQQQQQQHDQNQDDEEQQENEGEGDENQEQSEDENQEENQQESSPENSDQQNDSQNEDQQQQQQQDPTQMSPEEAQRILEALENEEEQLLRQVQKMKTRPRRVEKDW